MGGGEGKDLKSQTGVGQGGVECCPRCQAHIGNFTDALNIVTDQESWICTHSIGQGSACDGVNRQEMRTYRSSFWEVSMEGWCFVRAERGAFCGNCIGDLYERPSKMRVLPSDPICAEAAFYVKYIS